MFKKYLSRTCGASQYILPCRLIGILIGVTALTVILAPERVMAQQKTTFCLDGGLQIAADRFETRDGKFFIFVSGATEPLVYPAAAVHGINVQCQAPRVEPPALAHFGIYGSNTIGERLMPMLIEAFDQQKYHMKPQFKDTGTAEEQEISVRAPDGVKAVIDFKAHGSGTFARAILDDKAQIGMASRPINTDELKQFDDRYHVDMSIAGNEHVLALDGLAVVVNAGNPVKALSLDQIAGIFAGHITSWNAVGGSDHPIKLYRRDDKSGTTDTFKNLVLAPFHYDMSLQASQFESSEKLSQSVSDDVDGIGYIGMPYIGKNAALKLNSTCGIVGNISDFNVKTEIYPLSRRLFLYTVGTPTDSVARDILEFAESDDAQRTVLDAEFIDQSVALEDPAEQRNIAATVNANHQFGLTIDKEVPAAAVAGFTTEMSSFRRSSFVFRFQRGRSNLDTRAVQDVQRAVRYLTRQTAKRAIIVGFADSNGTWRRNLDLAKERANQVAHELALSGHPIQARDIFSYSYLAPVACNDTDAGQSKNRRVELWIEK